jgi:hydroxypyruvate isomerase
MGYGTVKPGSIEAWHPFAPAANDRGSSASAMAPTMAFSAAPTPVYSPPSAETRVHRAMASSKTPVGSIGSTGTDIMHDDPTGAQPAREHRASRRTVLGRLTATGVAAWAVGGWLTGNARRSALAAEADAAESQPASLKGRIRHSLVNWCYGEHFTSFDEFCQTARSLGCQSIELCPVEQWPTLKRHGLTCAISGSHGFTRGLNNPAHWDECLSILRKRLQQAADFGCPNVITFTGMSEQIDPEAGARNCVAALKQLAPLAEKLGVNLCLEMLNTRADDHPMKGHPGYQGNHTDYCVDILNAVGSPRAKLLFDVYHVQIMDGDVIRRIRQHRDWLGHIHTAGNPGRGELNDQQEIQYSAVMRALVEVGYQGFVGHEFIPTIDCVTGLRQAIAVCDV